MRFLIQYIIYFYKCFKSKIRKSFKKRYRFFIFNEHASHINIKVIKFYINNNIILLCLSSHIIYILQLLNIEFFLFLTTAYRKHLKEYTRYKKDYTINKSNFIRLIQMIKKNITTK